MVSSNAAEQTKSSEEKPSSRGSSREPTMETIVEEDSDSESPLKGIARGGTPDNDPFLTSASRNNLSSKMGNAAENVVVTLSKYADSNLIQALKKKYCSSRSDPSTTLPLLTPQATRRKVHF